MSLTESILLVVIGATFGVGGTFFGQWLTNFYQWRSERTKTLQAKRDLDAERFRPLVTDTYVLWTASGRRHFTAARSFRRLFKIA